MNENPSPNLCECGCGQPTLINRRTRGAQKAGTAQRWIRGHWARGRRTQLEPPNPAGICQCGCGRPAPRATMTNERHGHVAGEHMRFTRGHVGYLHLHRSITPQDYTIEDRGHPTPCWLWNGAMGSGGYCKAKFGGRRNQLVHRFMYEQEIGPIPEGLQIDHLCFVRHCINPAHLEAVTPSENMRRAWARRFH